MSKSAALSLILSQQNLWDLSNYSTYDVRALGEDIYGDPNSIPLPSAKYESMVTRFLGLLVYTNNMLSKPLCTKFNRATAGMVSYYIALFCSGPAKEQPDMSNQQTWHETLYDHFGQYFTVDNILYWETTGQQDLVIFENTTFGRVMALNGVVQTTERDEFIYHEMMTHVPLIAHGSAKKVLIIGGGDGGMLREVSRHPGVEQIIMVEIDVSVVTVCQKYLPNHNAGAFDDMRFTLVIADGVDFVSQSSEKFDVIISDCTDPIGPGKNLFTSDFYQGCARCLNQDGIFVAQNGVCFLQQEETVNSHRKLRHYFRDVSFYQAAVPTYYGGIMTFAWANQNPTPHHLDTAALSTRIDKTGLTYRYYNATIHNSSFALPQYLLNALSASR